MDNQRLHLYWRIVGIPLMTFLAVTVFFSWLFQVFYFRRGVLEDQTLQTLVSSLYTLAVFGSFAVTIGAILRRHRALLGRLVPVLTRTALMILIVLSSLGCALSLVIIGMTQLHIAGN